MRRIIVDVPKSGRTRGGTHAYPPEKRRKQKGLRVVNLQLLDHSCHYSTAIAILERKKEQQFHSSINARIKSKIEYCLANYKGKYRDVLVLLLQGKTTLQIARALGRTDRRIRQIVNGNQQNGKIEIGLIQIIQEMTTNDHHHHHPPPPPVVQAAGVDHGHA